MIYICRICGNEVKLRRNFTIRNKSSHDNKMRYPIPHLRNDQTCHGFFEEVIKVSK